MRSGVAKGGCVSRSRRPRLNSSRPMVCAHSTPIRDLPMEYGVPPSPIAPIAPIAFLSYPQSAQPSEFVTFSFLPPPTSPYCYIPHSSRRFWPHSLVPLLVLRTTLSVVNFYPLPLLLFFPRPPGCSCPVSALCFGRNPPFAKHPSPPVCGAVESLAFISLSHHRIPKGTSYRRAAVSLYCITLTLHISSP
jgi:hypothetical protein